VDPDISQQLEKRLGRLHAKLRLGIEADHEAQVFELFSHREFDIVTSAQNHGLRGLMGGAARARCP
jgi:hypothetical protein